MTEEFDEEVEFEYLQDLGRSDSEAWRMGCQEEEQAAGEGEGPLPQEGFAPLRRGVLWRAADAIRGLLSLYQSSMSDHEEQQLDAEFRRYSLRLLLEQDVFLQEDLELIELLDPGVLSVASASSPPAAPPRNRLLPSAWALWTLAVVVAVLAGLRSVWDGRGLSALVPWALALGGFLLVRGAALWRAARLSGAMRAHGAQLESLAQDSQALTALIRKALRLIQETEVISRGFTLLLDRVSAACPFNRAENQLLGLRRASYQTLHTAFRAYRHATRHMLSAYPLDSETDDAGNYLCTAPLGELGLGLGEGRPSDQRAQELTDDYGLPALKVLFQLFVGQSSEFFRRLALLLSPGREGRDARLARRAVAEVTGPLRLALCGCLGDLQRSYDFHRCFEAPRGAAAGSDRAARARQQCRELSDLHASVRSLQLHLRALLNEVIILEDELEKLLVSPETAETARAQDLRDRLRLLQPHMQASRGCWEDAVAQVGRMLRLSASRAGTPGTPEEGAPRLPPPPTYPATLTQDRDPVPEEQELEAYASSDSDCDSDWRSAPRDPLPPPGERERRRRGREESRPVLLELKSVLRLRASEGERQRWKQLLFREEAAARTTLPMEPSEPRGNSNRPEPYSQQNNHEGPAPCSTEARLCRGRSEGVRGRPAPRSPSARGSARAGGGAEGGSERDRAPPGGQSLYAVCDGQTDGPPQHSNHQHGGADLRG
ncbi:vezatin-like isoform X1 [Anguilla anguilla]|uniref:vezatin-like isoform X1 n=1 Tax=Anguilla anguilla TaxID=7936 RepID=UPI0015AA7E72|nr:vezatin-like isoform X1 [Anguilla anguilla]